MGNALLWIEMLASALLWMALVAACASGVKRPRVRGVLVYIGSALPLSIFGWFALNAIMLRFAAHMEIAWLWYALTLFISACVGLAVIGVRARPREVGTPPRAATWWRGTLAGAWLVFMALAATTLWNMDRLVRANARALLADADAAYRAASPAIPADEQNAAILYKKAFAQLRADPWRAKCDPASGKDLPFDPKDPAMLAFLARQAPTLALLRQAAAMPACHFGADLTVPAMLRVMPELNQARDGGNALALDARHQLAEGHIANAMADIDTVFKMGRHMSQGFGLITGLVAIGLEALGDQLLEDALPAVTQPEELTGLHLQAFSSDRRIYWRMFQAEECDTLRFIIGVYDQANRAATGNRSGPWPENPELSNPLGRVLLLSDELDGCIQPMDQCKQTTLEPYFKAGQQRERIREAGRSDRPHKGFFASVAGMSVLRTLETTAVNEAHDACTAVALAMTRYRLDHGGLPDHLADLVPAYLDSVPLDPFDGQPLRLIVKDNRWIIYSVGTSGKDAGSQTTPDWKKGYVVFVLKASAPATTRP
jgi:hypothetical protein